MYIYEAESRAKRSLAKRQRAEDSGVFTFLIHILDGSSSALENLAHFPNITLMHDLGRKQELKIKSSWIFCCFKI